VAVPGPATLPAAVLLDRDGTINLKAPEGAYITDPSAVELLPGAGRAVASLTARGVPVVVVTNQRGIALGRMTEDDLAAVHARLDALLAAAGGRVRAYLHCPHERGSCACRKPGTLLLEQARDLLGLADLRDAVMIGDAVSDVQAGRRAGARAIRLAGADAPPDGFERAQSLLVAVRRVLGEDG
jgi:D-glycero-D-manno-heptose 1,7-bisphosphate phosphatase